MKRLLFIQLFLLSVVAAFPKADNRDIIYEEWKAAISINDTIKLKQIVLELSSDSINEDFETKLVHTAIDYLSPYALILLTQYKMGYCDTESNRIKPLDYLLDDNFEDRMLRAYNEPIYENENLMQRLYRTLRIIYSMQRFKIDEGSLKLMRTKFEDFFVKHKDINIPPATY